MSSELTSSQLLTTNELKTLRSKVQVIIKQLILPNKATTISSSFATEQFHDSWVRGQIPLDKNKNITENCQFFDQFGFCHIQSFATPFEVTQLKQQMKDLTDTWDPQLKTMAFSTNVTSNETQGSDDYFLESANRVHFFAESHALDDNHKLKCQYKTNKLMALTKAGHGMHMIPGPFQTYCQSNKVKQLVADLGWIDPVVPQSMYLCKNPNIGGTVHSHQDSTFLFTEPRQSCLGLWLALDDATLENGCLWIRPGSHRESVRRHFQRNTLHFGHNAIDTQSNIGQGDITAPKMIFKSLPESIPIRWDGALPDGSEPPYQGLIDAGFIPIECKAGDLLAFPGTLDHFSLPNTSNAQRHTFQLHLVEGPGAGITWSKHNWLQYPKGVGFLSIKLN